MCHAKVRCRIYLVKQKNTCSENVNALDRKRAKAGQNFSVQLKMENWFVIQQDPLESAFYKVTTKSTSKATPNDDATAVLQRSENLSARCVVGAKYMYA